ncbi:unnamed protein product [Didymodactylos carnosus]|uniref:FAD-binding domain-containing protein n=1 Tax=Didymodactylos carnosus TaxID=1234261 RepID=A0A815SPI4_9BILA|nr:unnamed protein product [Didymodactylos carnosus]CAF4356324.1 unnamed protein product [Didymodactylos carnosus]
MHSMLSRSLSYSTKNLSENRSVLIVGAGVAGPVLAYFLHRFGVRPVVVERAPQLRTAGQTIDVRGAGREVLRRMGIDRIIRENHTQEEGVAIVDSAGRTRAAFGVESFGGQGFVADIEILRSELVRILYEHSRNHTEYIFGDHPSSINDRGDHVQVTFASGNVREFDLVIGADGMQSKTRRLVFGNNTSIHHLNVYTAYFTIPYSQSDGRWARWYNAPKERTVLIRPDNQGTTRAVLLFRTSQRGYEDLDVDMQKELLRNVFADAGFETPRVLSGMKNANDFYFDAIAAIKMDRWSEGRVVLVGDAGYSSGVSGRGTTLAFIGAYILAGEIGCHQDHTKAFIQYETLMRPYVTAAQKITPGSIRVALPKTRTAIALRNTVLSFAARPAVTGFITKLTKSKTAEKVTFPDYETILAQQ